MSTDKFINRAEIVEVLIQLGDRGREAANELFMLVPAATLALGRSPKKADVRALAVSNQIALTKTYAVKLLKARAEAARSLTPGFISRPGGQSSSQDQSHPGGQAGTKPLGRAGTPGV